MLATKLAPSTGTLNGAGRTTALTDTSNRTPVVRRDSFGEREKFDREFEKTERGRP